MALIAFDLDGTLIDSLFGIHASIKYVCENNSFITPDIEKLRKEIGPSLKSYLPKIINQNDDKIINLFLKEFNKHHIEIGFKNYYLYKNSEKILKDLKDKDNNIVLITNKPFKITLKALTFLSIDKLFDNVYSKDSCSDTEFLSKFEKPIFKKSLYLNYLSNKNKEFQKIYIGDVFQDFLSTQQNDFEFIFASYGYGEFYQGKCLFKGSSITDIYEFICDYIGIKKKSFNT